MTAHLIQLPALIAAAALLLPPGFCCYPGGENAAAASLPQRSCCHKSADAHKPVAPHCPQGVCCCAKDAVSPRDLNMVGCHADGLVTLAPSPPQVEIAQPALQTVCVLSTGPPLRVLHCVWLI